MSCPVAQPSVLRRMQRDDTPAEVGVIQTEPNMLLRESAHRRRPGSRRRRWTLLTPTVLWSVIILAMAPSFYGFAGGLGGLPAGLSAGRSAGVEAADLPGAGGAGGAKGRAVGARSSPFAAASWLKERVRDGTRRVQMQVGRWRVLVLFARGRRLCFLWAGGENLTQQQQRGNSAACL